VPITDFSDPVFVDDGEQIDRIARTAADVPVTFDGGARSGRQLTQSLAGLSPQLGMAVAHFLSPGFSFNRDCGKPFFCGLMFQELRKQGIVVFLLLDGSPCGGELSRRNFIRLAL